MIQSSEYYNMVFLREECQQTLNKYTVKVEMGIIQTIPAAHVHETPSLPLDAVEMQLQLKELPLLF